MPVQANVKGRTLILLEDIIDTGFTLQYVTEKMRQAGAADVRIATMLFKPDSLQCALKPDYIGFPIPCDFIVGYGLDYEEMGRAYRDVISSWVTDWTTKRWGGPIEIFTK